jgi:aminoglycoside phosphotransferase (APT) family kinase protein
MTEDVAGARAVRDEDAFDVDAVAAWLRAVARDPAGLDGTPVVRQFSGGASNLTYLLRYPARDLILRRAPRGTKAKGAHDMRREFVIQSALAPVFPYVAPMVGFCDDPAVLGGDFYVMERIDGLIPRSTWPAAVPLSAEQARELCLNVVEVYAELHSVDANAAGLADFGKGTGYVRRQVEGWSARYRNAHTPDNPEFTEVMAWLDAHQPDDVANCVIHNDFKVDNLVFSRDDPTRVIGVLDWEMATLGDPLADLGYALLWWGTANRPLINPSQAVADLPGMPSASEVCSLYGAEPDAMRFHVALAAFKLAIIGAGNRARAKRTGVDVAVDTHTPLATWALELLSENMPL